MSQEIAIAINNLTVSYHQRPVLRGVIANIVQGSLTAVMGPNGAGKSTLFKAILGLIPRDTGDIAVFGSKNIAAVRRRIAYIPQKEQIDWDFPVTVRDVVMMGRYQQLGWLKWAGAQDREKVDKALVELNMQEFGNRHIRLLSGGQQQRVFIARALVQESEVLFMDEPFVGVDSTTQQAIFLLIAKLKQAGKTIVMINHDFSIMKHFDYLMLLNRQMIALGPPQQVYNEHNIAQTYGGRITMIEEAENSLWGAKQ